MKHREGILLAVGPVLHAFGDCLEEGEVSLDARFEKVSVLEHLLCDALGVGHALESRVYSLGDSELQYLLRHVEYVI